MPWRVLLNSRYRVTKLALKYPFSWKLDLCRLHELAGNFLRPKMFPPSPDNGKLYSRGTQGHSHKVPLEQLYVLSAISSMACRKGAEPQRCVWHWAGGGLGGLGVAKDKEKHQKKYWRDNLEMRRCGRFSRGGKRVMEAKWKAKNRNGIGKRGVN